MFQTRSQSHEDARAAFPDLAQYLVVKAACYADYKDSLHQLPNDLELEECANYLSEWPNVRILNQWQLRELDGRPWEPEVALELAVSSAVDLVAAWRPYVDVARTTERRSWVSWCLSGEHLLAVDTLRRSY
ncbi:hypothetical protein GSI_07434 [Ganoderma sinense ZZ0214-1]|uniref:Uncharacterized protein n=1 Tax=Ganoderma sinense ZZ0214-1 TaxID=1077348 RepID=A0A2G8S911_9APHY|nr:hypothetical protein GSI_07434 [Ganoderma sinense ZZ0214-1]